MTESGNSEQAGNPEQVAVERKVYDLHEAVVDLMRMRNDPVYSEYFPPELTRLFEAQTALQVLNSHILGETSTRPNHLRLVRQ